ncbi:MAG: glycoside hydrolase family 88 protein [Lachnospiraceae bacterium]|nr:glycoside hydrolase family 88 protein [Lachnospiraceae bacterium]
MDKEFDYSIALNQIYEKLLRNHNRFTKKYPHISGLRNEEMTLNYKPMENDLWTSSFFPGEMLLAYGITHDRAFLSDAEAYLESFGYRLNNKIGISHDLGFLYSLTCVSLHRLTGDALAKELSQKAAKELFLRYNSKGKFIQAWGEIGVGNPYVKIIADTMLNLPLLYQSGISQYADAASEHAYTSAKYIVRDDFSSFHTYLMDPVTGKAVEGRTHQGFRDSSTWARGQAWIVYGYALSYGYTREKKFIEISQKAADYFIERLPANKVSYWDLTFSDRIPDIRDTSATAILATGLLELSEYLEKEQARKYTDVAKEILKKMYEQYFYPNVDSPVLLTDGMYHRDNGSTGTIWGDYFFMEALAKMSGHYVKFW